jgi:hypothetical protein
VVFLSCRKKEYLLLRLNSIIKRFVGLLKKDLYEIHPLYDKLAVKIEEAASLAKSFSI